jgi:hypothetical protein
MQKQGLSTPLDEKPNADIFTDWYISAFFRLDSARGGSGFAINPLAISDILLYLEYFEAPFDWEFSFDLLQKMDSLYLKLNLKEAERKSKSKSKR